MPLSEEELRLLEQMERALAAEDPKFASTLQGHPFGRAARWRAIIAGVVFLGGVAILLGGAMAQRTWVGVVGFVVMLASATIGLAAWRGRNAPPTPRIPDAPPAQHPSGRPFDVIEGGKAGKTGKAGKLGRRHGFLRRRGAQPHGVRRPHGFGRPRRSGRPHGSTGGQPGLVRRMEERWQRRRQQGY